MSEEDSDYCTILVPSRLLPAPGFAAMIPKHFCFSVERQGKSPEAKEREERNQERQSYDHYEIMKEINTFQFCRPRQAL